MLPSQNAKDIKLLIGNIIWLEKAFVFILQPTGGVKQINGNFVMHAGKLRLLYFFFDFHGKDKAEDKISGFTRISIKYYPLINSPFALITTSSLNIAPGNFEPIPKSLLLIVPEIFKPAIVFLFIG